MWGVFGGGGGNLFVNMLIWEKLDFRDTDESEGNHWNCDC